MVHDIDLSRATGFCARRFKSGLLSANANVRDAGGSSAHDDILEAPLQGSRQNAATGGVAERSKAPVLKTGIPAGIGGSNPSPSAIPRSHRSGPLVGTRVVRAVDMAYTRKAFAAAGR
jgi:hypothetical protein